MGIKIYQETNTRPLEKELAQSDSPIREKSKKPSEVPWVVVSDGFWDNDDPTPMDPKYDFQRCITTDIIRIQ